ncbi:hypothetical protein BGX38DRAFT_1111389 [Terfezia claveryi]|nr:hypothetical protein BGX38DRAFT_1111389 [Terfezia claveryi]
MCTIMPGQCVLCALWFWALRGRCDGIRTRGWHNPHPPTRRHCQRQDSSRSLYSLHTCFLFALHCIRVFGKKVLCRIMCFYYCFFVHFPYSCGVLEFFFFVHQDTVKGPTPLSPQP